jgi:hypothetical protein
MAGQYRASTRTVARAEGVPGRQPPRREARIPSPAAVRTRGGPSPFTVRLRRRRTPGAGDTAGSGAPAAAADGSRVAAAGSTCRQRCPVPRPGAEIRAAVPSRQRGAAPARSAPARPRRWPCPWRTPPTGTSPAACSAGRPVRVAGAHVAGTDCTGRGPRTGRPEPWQGCQAAQFMSIAVPVNDPPVPSEPTPRSQPGTARVACHAGRGTVSVLPAPAAPPILAASCSSHPPPAATRSCP